MWSMFADVRRCRAEVWKAVACTLHIKPCVQGSHSNALCKYVLGGAGRGSSRGNYPASHADKNIVKATPTIVGEAFIFYL